MHMKTYTSIITIALAAFLLVSCERDANIDLPEVDAKLVVTCFISPQDTLLTAHVERSQPVFQPASSTAYATVTDATITISNGTTSAQFVYDGALDLYTLNPSAFPIASGITYSLTVTTPKGESVSSSTTVPAPAGTDYAATVTSITGTAPDLVYSIKHTWTDLAGQNDFYRIIPVHVMLNSQLPGDTLFVRFRRRQNHLETDKNNDGGQVELNEDEYNEQFQSSDSLIAFESYLVHASREYYLYHQSLENNDGGADPFSEPTLMYTNITGGYGVFAGFTSVKRRFPL